MIPATKTLLLVREDDFDLANELQNADLVRARRNFGNRALVKNQLIVGPRLRSSKVLRDTIGERFLFDRKRPLFVNEFVSRVCCYEHNSSLEEFAGVNSRLRILCR